MDNGPTRRILVIEDDEVAAEFAQSVLEEAGYEVVVASDGQTGLDIATSDDKIALVVLDVGLPDISGYEVCARIRTDLDASDIPVLMLTAKSSEQDRFSGMVLADADAYLTKPADPLTLLATAESLIRRRRR
jgi:two-component system catabolic regulation response regulator CreB